MYCGEVNSSPQFLYVSNTCSHNSILNIVLVNSQIKMKGDIMPEISWPSWGLGAILAIIVLILVIVLAVIGKMPGLEALLFGLLALARLT